MRPAKLTAALAFKIDPQARSIVETLAKEKQLGLGEAARELLRAGIEARGLS